MGISVPGLQGPLKVEGGERISDRLQSSRTGSRTLDPVTKVDIYVLHMYSESMNQPRLGGRHQRVKMKTPFRNIPEARQPSITDKNQNVLDLQGIVNPSEV